MSADEISIKITARDDFSARAREAGKAANALEKEMAQARRELDRTGQGRDELEKLEAQYRQLREEQKKNSQEARKLQSEIRQTGQTGATAAKQATTAWGKFKRLMANPLVGAASIASVVYFGKRAVEAFSAAEVEQQKLNLAYAKFPSITDVSRESFAALATEMQNLTGVDDDLVAGAASILARFELTGTEIQKLLPLVNDLAIAEGKEIPDAADMFGKALLGNTRAVKALGVDFQATGDRTRDLASLMQILEDKVGGAGEAFGQTAAGKLAIANANFGDLQEQIGQQLVPALTGLVSVLKPANEFFARLPEPVRQFAIGIGFLGAAILAIGPRLSMMGFGLDAIKTKAIGATNAVMGMGRGAAKAGLAIAAYSAATMAAGQANGGTGIMLSKVEDVNAALRRMTGDSGFEGLAKKAKGFDEIIGDFFAGGSINTTMEQSTRMLAELDSTLTNLVASGNASAAERQFSNLVDRAEEWGGSVDDVRRVLPNYTKTLEGATAAAKRHSPAAEAVANATDNVVEAASRLIPKIDTETTSTWKAVTAARALKVAKDNAARAADRLSGALDGVSAAVQRSQAMRAYNDAMAQFIQEPSEEAFEAVVTAAAGAADAIDNPRKKARFAKSAFEELGEIAEGLDIPPYMLNALRDVVTEAKNAKTAIDLIPTTKTITMYINKVGQIPQFATGGLVDHSPFATSRAAGLLSGPGSGTSDSITARLSSGEFVVRAAAVKAIGVENLYRLNRADSRPVYVAPKMTAPQLVQQPSQAPVLTPAIGEVHVHHPSSGVDVQAEVLWAMRRAERLQRERS